MKKRKKLTLTQKRSLTGLSFILPWLIGFFVFYLRSLFMTVQFSLSEIEINPQSGGFSLNFVGWENFHYAFQVHGSFKQILTTSVMDILIDVPLIIFFSLFMALVLNRKFRGRTLVRAIFFLPVIMNSEAIAGAISYSRQMLMGGLSAASAEVMESTGGMGISYYIDMFESLGMPASILEYIVGAIGRITDIISASGVQIIIFIAALQAVPSSMYEVAKIEGATAYETFWKVTFPMVLPHIITNFVYTVVVNFADSDIVTLAYETAFKESNYGLSSAFSIVSTLVVCLILVVVCGAIQKRTFYYN